MNNNQATIAKMKELRLHGMAHAFQTTLETSVLMFSSAQLLSKQALTYPRPIPLLSNAPIVLACHNCINCAVAWDALITAPTPT